MKRIPRYKILTKTKQKQSKKIIIGFDTETDENADFVLGSFYSEKEVRTFTTREEMQNAFKERQYRSVLFVATNLSFDFNSIFPKEDEDLHERFNFLFRGSNIISIYTYIDKYNFSQKGKYKIEFIDTVNFAPISVENWGKILNLPKLDKPKALGLKPLNKAEFEELLTYNIRDSEISYKALEMLFTGFYKLGASPKITIASTSMSLFRNKYLENEYFVHEKGILRDLFKAYYGGRTEVFKRGKIENMNYYDVNSLYPFIMKSCKFPDPSSLRYNTLNQYKYINDYEGISFISVDAPMMRFPILPFRKDGKLIFPVGEFEGWFTHAEIRKAKKLGYKIINIKKTYYYKRTCEPFKNFVNDLYAKRMEYKLEGSILELVTKLLLNSLYGKFGQKFDNRENFVPFTDNIDLTKHRILERIGRYVRITDVNAEPSVFCFPEWAVHITAYARLHMHNLLVQGNAVYTDTDSLITENVFETSKELGELKLEHGGINGMIIKPKMYLFTDDKGEEIHKCKGLMRVDFEEFRDKVKIGNPEFNYKKFIKMKESVRRKMKTNLVIDTLKKFNLEDNKRNWKEKEFNPFLLADSKAFVLVHLESSKNINIAEATIPIAPMND